MLCVGVVIVFKFVIVFDIRYILYVKNKGKINWNIFIEDNRRSYLLVKIVYWYGMVGFWIILNGLVGVDVIVYVIGIFGLVIVIVCRYFVVVLVLVMVIVVGSLVMMGGEFGVIVMVRVLDVDF